MKMCSFARNINPTLWRFEGNPLRIDEDIDENAVLHETYGYYPLLRTLEKLTLLCKGLKEIY